MEAVREKGGKFFIPRTFPKTSIPDEVFVNREKELEILFEEMEIASKLDDEGVILPIISESGQGKSTILNIFAQRLESMDDGIKIWKIRARELLEKKSIEQEITKFSEIPKFVSLDHLEDVSNISEFLGKLKDRVQNEWSRVLVCFATTGRFYEENVKPVMDLKTSYKVVFKEIPELRLLKPLSPESQKMAIKNWTKYRSKELFGKTLEISQLVKKDALESLSTEYSIGNALKELNKCFLKSSFDQLPLGIDALKEEKEEVKLPKIIIATTYSKKEVRKVQNEIRTDMDKFLERLWKKRVPKSAAIRIAENLLLVHLEDNFMAKALYHSRIFEQYKDKYKLKPEDIDIFSSKQSLKKRKAIQILSESSLSGVFGIEKSEIVPEKGIYTDKILSKFHKFSGMKSTVGNSSICAVLENAGIEQIQEETKRVIRIDISVPTGDKMLAIECTFGSPNASGRLMNYIVDKCAKYYKNYLK